MNVRSAPVSPSDGIRKESGNTEKIERAFSGEFRRQLTLITNEKLHDHFRSLIERIREQGERVAKRADIKEFFVYKELVMELMNDTVNHAYLFNKSRGFDRQGRHKVLTIIQNVNQKLDALTASFLNEQADQLTLLTTLDDIRGMLVDLLL